MIEFQQAGVTVLAQQATGQAPLDILAPVSVTLSERRIAILGSNGSGKTTLARLVNGLTLATAGRVLVDGLDPAVDGPAVRSRVGFVFSDADAQLVMPTAIEDVSLSLRRSRLSRREREARALDVLAQFGLADKAHTPVHALSGGQKQLLAIAGVLATEPHIVVIDEPTTRLDLRWRDHVLAVIASLPQQVLMVTHDLPAAVGFERALVVDQGAIVFDGSGAAAVEHYTALVRGSDAGGGRQPGVPAEPVASASSAAPPSPVAADRTAP